MKKAILYSAMALSTLSLSSCGDDFLVLDPVGSVSEGTLTTPEGIDYVLTGAYSTLNNMNTFNQWYMGSETLSNWVFGDIMGVDANKGSTAGDQSDLTALEIYSFTSANSYISQKWVAVYEAVKRANNVLSMTEKLGDAMPNRTVVDAQAKFLKAVWMFEGVRVYGAYIPYISLADYQSETDPKVSNHTEGSQVADIAIWKNIEADLKDAVNGLPETWGSEEQGRATSWMAKAMLAKLYLYWSSPYNGKNATENHWNDAKALLDDIIANGQDAKGQKYTLAKTYGELWDANKSDWTGESVFDVQLTISGNAYTTNTINNVYPTGSAKIGGWGFYQPTYELVNSYLVDENGLPEANYTAKEPLTTIPDGLNPQSDLVSFTDPRLDVSVGRFGVPFLDYEVPQDLSWVRDFTNGGLYMNKKTVPAQADRGVTSVESYATSSAKNFHVIRFAEILLMRAEVAINEGDLQTALTYINKVRERAANSALMAADHDKAYGASKMAIPTTYKMENKVNGTTTTGTVANYRIGLYTSFGSKEEAHTALEREMRAEFAMEGHRWFDIARWGTAGKVLNTFCEYEKKYLPKYSNRYNENWVTMPIPNDQLQTAEGRLVQGPNWQ